MAQLLFPDNTTLINFALINRMDLLARLANGNGNWCATVAGECARSTSVPGLEALGDASDIFGPPLFPETPAERIDIHNLRIELAQPGDPNWKHLGEAETLIIMSRRGLSGFFVTDDTDARLHAAREGVVAITTWDLLRVATRNGLIDRPTLWGYVQTLRANQRGTPPGVHDVASLDKWLDASG